MKGFKVKRKAGWDTHGLPVEIEVEKRLGLKSMEEHIPDFERYGIRLSMEAHPYDFVELHDRALELVRSVDKDWLGYEYCCPHTFHLSDGAGDAGRMIRLPVTSSHDSSMLKGSIISV